MAQAERQIIREQIATGSRSIDFRRARTRTLIQLGGLLEKAGLADLFGIELGQDLQTDDEVFEEAAALVGALLELKSIVEPDSFSQQKLLWAQKGKIHLGKK
jgi:hypothetical protein